MTFFSALVSTFLVPLVAFAPLMAQTAEPAPNLQVQVLEQSSPDQVKVQVSDAAGNPVSDAAVVFRLPEGSFLYNGTGTTSVSTDASGIAQVSGIHWGAAGGTVRITASKGTAHAGVLFEKAAAPAAMTSPAAPVAQAVPPTQPPAPQVPVQKTAPPQPGIIVANDDSPDANVPIRPMVEEAAGGLTPRMSIVSSGQSSSDHHLRNRVLIGLAVVAAGGAAFAFTHKAGSSSSSSSSGVSVGPPTVSVGHP